MMLNGRDIEAEEIYSKLFLRLDTIIPIAIRKFGLLGMI